jgi:hypothetical protein
MTSVTHAETAMQARRVGKGTMGWLSGIVLIIATGPALAQPEYLHLTRHRDAGGNLILAPAQSEHSSVASPHEPVTEPPAVHEHQAVAQDSPVHEPVAMEEPVVHESVGGEQAEEALMAQEPVIKEREGQEAGAQAPDADDPIVSHEPVIDQGTIAQEPVMNDSEGQEIVAEDPVNHDEMMTPETIVHEPAIHESDGHEVMENASVIQDGTSDQKSLAPEPEGLEYVVQESSNQEVALEPEENSPPSLQTHDVQETSDPAVTASPLADEASIVQKTALPSQPNLFERRNADWGMSIQEIKANESLRPAWELYPPILDEATYRIAYRTTIEGIQSSLAYTFYQDQLAQAKYVFEPQHNDPGRFVGDFHMVREWISEAYGPPSSVEEIWLDTLYQYDDSLRGQALMRGHLIMVAEWKTLETQIVLVLNGGDDTVGMVADFSSSRIRLPAPQQDSSSLSEATQDPGAKESDPDSSL